MRIHHITEAPIAATDNPNDPMIYGHQKANSMTLHQQTDSNKYRN